MKKTILLLLVLGVLAHSQKEKFVVSVSGELDVNLSDALADIINHAVVKSQLYSVLPNDRQFREILKKEWKKGNVSDDRIIALAKNAGTDYLCFAKITSLLNGNQITVYMVNLKSEPMEYSNAGIARGKLTDLDYFAEKIQEAVDDMLGTAKGSSGKSGIASPVQEKTAPPSASSGVLTDKRDGKQYKVVKIGSQTWMADNLNYEAGKSACYACKKYGRLYDWNTATQICPEGWHLPKNEEWKILETYVGGALLAERVLKSESGWKENHNGTNDYDFSALPGGLGNPNGSFDFVGDFGYWWSATPSRWNAYAIHMGYYGEVSRKDYDRSFLFSVRCIKDSVRSSTTSGGSGGVQSSDVSGDVLTDSRDSKKYKVVKIGSQIWMAENLNYAASGSKCYDKTENCVKYGRLYDWHTAMNACPSGWHLPKDNEWNVLMAAVDGIEMAGRKLKAKSGWYDNGNGTDEFGFSALPGGYGDSDSKFKSVGDRSYWWSADHSYYYNYGYYWFIDYSGENVKNGNKDNSSLLSVRCVWD